MRIAYIEPFGRAWERMKLALFRPFDLHKWFVVGFNAFLAGLADMHNGSGSSRSRDRFHFGEFLDFPNRAWRWLMAHPGWFIAIIFGAMVVLVIVVIVIWLSSRGKFMFLDNVVHNKEGIAKPWKEYRKESDALFLWRLVFGFICLVVFFAFAVFFFVAGRQLYYAGFGRQVPVLFLIGMGTILFMLLVLIGFIAMFLDSFVVPIMYKSRVSATQGWRRFLTLFGQHPLHFILYGVLMIGLYILFVISVIIVGILTCCIGWAFLVIPYIGTVVTLPVWYTFRAFSLEFLAQFGPEYVLFPPSEAEPEAAPA
jgi:hypothetical protein